MSIRRFIAAAALSATVVAGAGPASAYRVTVFTAIDALATAPSGVTVQAVAREIIVDVSEGPLGVPVPFIDRPATLIVRDSLGDLICVAEDVATFIADPLGATVRVTSTEPGCTAELTWQLSGPPTLLTPLITPEDINVSLTTDASATGTVRGESVSDAGASTTRSLRVLVDV